MDGSKLQINSGSYNKIKLKIIREKVQYRFSISSVNSNHKPKKFFYSFSNLDKKNVFINVIISSSYWYII